MVDTLPWIISFIGLALITIMYRKGWPGWYGLPLIIVIGVATLAAGISPIVEGLADGPLGQLAKFTDLDITEYANDEVPGAIGLILIGYGSLALGMLVVLAIGNNRHGKRSGTLMGKSWRQQWFDPATTDQLWRASLVLLGVGLICYCYIMYRLAQVTPVAEWTASRALYTSVFFSEDPLYNHAISLSSTMELGAWAMLIFAPPRRERLIPALVANAAYLALQVLFGGRLRLIVGFYAVVVVYHYGVRPLRVREWIAIPIVGMMAFVVLETWRYGLDDLQASLQGVAESLFVPRSIGEATWALRYWPDAIPYFGGKTTLHGLRQALPTVEFWDSIGTERTWQYMVDLFYGGKNLSVFRYGGGAHFGYPVEEFIDLGPLGTVAAGLFYGFLLGWPFEWSSRQPRNPFQLLLTVIAISVLLMGLEGKMATAVGYFFFFRLLPIGLMSSMVRSGKTGDLWRTRLAAGIYGVGMFSLLRALTGLILFDCFLALFLGFSYLSSIMKIQTVGETRSLKLPDHGDLSWGASYAR